jgi:uncharacterized RDD family membrane protein YckC
VLTEEPSGGPAESPQVGPDAPRDVGPGSAVPLAAQPLQGRRAGLVTRALADGVDFAVVAGILVLTYLGVAAARFIWRSWTFSFPTPSFLLVLVLGAVVSVLYLTATWGTTGHSYGKHVLGLRVVGPFGRLRVAGAFMRAVLCVIFPVGLAWVLVSRQNRSLQDVVLRTSVVYDWLGEGPPSAAREERG